MKLIVLVAVCILSYALWTNHSSVKVNSDAPLETFKLWVFPTSGAKLETNNPALLKSFREFGVKSVTLNSPEQPAFVSTAVFETDRQTFTVKYTPSFGYERGIKKVILGEGAPVVQLSTLPTTATEARLAQEELEKTLEMVYHRVERGWKDAKFPKTGQF